MDVIDDPESKEKLLKNIKKEVKQLMEVAATCKFIHEDNSCINSLCATIECCLLHGLKNNGLQKNNHSINILKKISKQFEPANVILKLYQELEALFQTQLLSNSIGKDRDNFGNIFIRLFSSNNHHTLNTNEYKNYSYVFRAGSSSIRFFWIKLAILNKVLIPILEFIISHSNKLYFPYALIADPVNSELFCYLLAGPCSLEYTRFKTCDNLLTDPDADELIRRHKMHSLLNNNNLINTLGNLNNSHKSSNSKKNTTISTPLSPVKNSPIVKHTQHMYPQCYQSNISNSQGSGNNLNNSQVSLESCNPKEYVESLHQNLKSTILYGKNNVIVNQKKKSFRGYLSLHLNSHNLMLKWTPNELINVSINKSIGDGCWNDAIQIDMKKISFLHCHQQMNNDSTLILVADDGVQYPPIIFPNGTHLYQFLTCLESGLKPDFDLEPSFSDNLIQPNTTISVIIKIVSTATQKTFQRPISRFQRNYSTDYIELTKDKFSSLNFSRKDEEDLLISPMNSLLDSSMSSSTPTDLKIGRANLSKRNSTYERKVLKSVCNEMKYKIVYRAFYGWLKYHRQIRTINKHLVNLIKMEEEDEIKTNPDDQSVDQTMRQYLFKKKPVDEALWNDLIKDKSIFERNLFYKCIYYNGIESDFVRKQIWPYLLHHYEFEMEADEKYQKDKHAQDNYFKLVSQWKPFEEYYHLKDKQKSSAVATPTTSLNSDDSGVCSDLTASPSSFARSSSSSKKMNHLQSAKIAKRLPTDKLLLESMETPKLSTIENKGTKSQNNFSFHDPKSTIGDYNLSKVSFIPKGFLDKFKSNNIFAKLIQKSEKNNENKITKMDIESLPETLPHTPMKVIQIKNLNINNNKLTDDQVRLELAEMLVTNAILRAKHELTLDSSISQQDFMNSKTENQTENRSRWLSLNKLHEIKQLSLLERNKDYESYFGKEDKISSDLCDNVSYCPLESDLNENKIDSEIYNDNSIMSPFYPIMSSSTSSAIDTNEETILNKTKIEKSDQDSTEIFNNNLIFKASGALSPISENISISNKELFETFCTNMHRIDKDVARCDRNYWYFSNSANLTKLKNIVYTYVWENIKTGYVQGMCDLAAPLLVILNDEPLVYSCFTKIMKRMSDNFLHNTAMDKHFNNLSSLVKALDNDLYEQLLASCDQNQFYFTYRWFLLDFKRELIYKDIFSVWETIWSANHAISENYSLFIALALIETYRDIIIENNMDFTDIIKFFNEMSEKHNVKDILDLARNFTKQLQTLIKTSQDSA